ncbi:MAG: putative Zn-ribbon and HTH transcriptional regulator [Desulforhopalus sp.]|jgi:predicted Zn-ribbon and HTH transcriptional regulator
MNNKKIPLELADVFRKYGESFRRKNYLSSEQSKSMRHIETCRTAELGGHIEVCNHCGFQKNAYNSCRDRHCPKCQTLVKEKWLKARKSELLPCPYFHNVFTVPHELNPLILTNKRIMLSILFVAVKETLQAFAADPQWRLEGQLGFISVLHTWNQKLMDHFHLHCIIPAGALSFDKKQWVATKNKYLFRVQSLAKEFRKRYLKKLETAYNQSKLKFYGRSSGFKVTKDFLKLIEAVKNKSWIAYSKQPFGGPEQVLEYLGRYTHRVAITNNRLTAMKDGNITFTYRDSSDENKTKELTVTAEELIRRYLLHILPSGFMKIRYYGFLASTNKKDSIPFSQQLIEPNFKTTEKQEETIQEIMLRLTGNDISRCPECGKGEMIYTVDLPVLEINSS